MLSCINSFIIVLRVTLGVAWIAMNLAVAVGDYVNDMITKNLLGVPDGMHAW